MDATNLPSTVFEPIDVPSTYEATVVRLGVAIRVGVLESGTRLPPERDLAERLEISRSTLRQALGTLTKTGHLVAVRGRSGGTFVANDPPLVSGDPYPLKGARGLLDWRRTIELGAAQLAAERADAQALAALTEAAAEMEDEEVVADWPRFRRADASFHIRLAEATSCDRIVRAVLEIQGELCELLTQLEPSLSARHTTLDQHRAVVDAIREGDADAARAAMSTHLAVTERVVVGDRLVEH